MKSPSLSLNLDSVLAVANEGFAQQLAQVGPDDWSRQTPCAEWNVRALVNHVVGANVRYELLLGGAGLAEVEATRETDHLGDDAVAAFGATAGALADAFREPGVHERTLRHVTGDRTGAELLAMRILDVGVHGWDLARAVGGDDTIDARIVLVALTGTTEGPDEADDASPQDRLLVRLGRRPTKEDRQ
jgi:uncharacterized protein (TIGR03086 family)